MNLRKRLGWLAGGLLLRRAIQDLHAIAEQQAQTNRLLKRLIDHIAPEVPTALPTEDARATLFDPTEGLLAAHYIAKVEREQGRTPTDDEVASYLDDEKTLDLRVRLEERERHLQDLMDRR